VGVTTGSVTRCADDDVERAEVLVTDEPAQPGSGGGGSADQLPPIDVRSTVPASQVPEPVQQTEQYVLTIGDIGVTPNWVVTPNGSAPLAGSRWIVADRTTTQSKIPAWAIVLAIIFALFCLVGLLFLLVKERTTTGYVEVSVMSGNLSHMTQVGVQSETDIARIRQLVHQAQTLAATAGS
jgi:hypothetical protein